MRIFDYDKFTKEDKRRSIFAELCKNHRVTGSKEDGKVVGDNGSTFTSDEDWESEVPDFMVGDRVVIKTWEQMKTEYGLDKFGSIKCEFGFIKAMRNLCGKKQL